MSSVCIHFLKFIYNENDTLELYYDQKFNSMACIDDDEIYSDVEAPPISSPGDYNISYRAPQYDNTVINYIEKYGFGDFVRV